MTLTDLIEPGDIISDVQRDNARLTVAVVNEFETEIQKDYPGVKFQSTSGIRSMEKLLAIYTKLRAEDQAAGRPLREIPMHDTHLLGQADDFVGIGIDMKDLQTWFLKDTTIALAESLGAYFESFVDSVDHIHLQIVPPASGKRFFLAF